MPMTPSCQSAPATTYPFDRRCSSGHDSISLTALARIRSSTPWRSRFSRSSSSASRVASCGILGEQQLERRLGPAEPPGRVDARREPEADRGLVDRRRIDAGDAHQRLQARLLRLGEPAQPAAGERAVLVDERHDVGDRRQRDHVEVALEERMVGAEQRLGELPDDSGAAEAR